MNSRTIEIIAASAALLLQASAFAAEVDGIAATVGAQSILRSEVVNEMRRTGADESRFNEVRNALIERKLIVKAAADAKMTMQEWVVDNRIREIVDTAFEGDRNKLVAALAKQKLPFPEWRQKVKDDMIVGAMRWSVVDKNVTASPAEMRAEYEAHPERYRSDGAVTVSVIMLKPEDAGKRDEVTEGLKEASFAELAKKYSAGSRAKEGGLWKDVRPQEVFRPEICDEIAKMPVGTLSDWIDLAGWSFLLRKESETAAGTKFFEDAYVEVEEHVKRANAQKMYLDWIERLKSETYIKVY